MMVCLIFHTAIIINNKNWRITIKNHFESLSIFFKKSKRTHMLRPPSPCLFLFVFQGAQQNYAMQSYATSLKITFEVFNF